jgi:uncharacterized beta barrel domain-containing protein DUF5777
MTGLLLLPSALTAQERRGSWQRRGSPTEVPVVVFHSTQSANLPTAETLAKGELLFEISHRFSPAISEGADALWGLDGPAVNRFGIAYAVSDRAMVGVLRSSLTDNLDLQLKLRLTEGGGESTAYMVGVVGGVAINPEPIGVSAFDEESLQYYAQAILNVAPTRQLALGLVPGYVRNVDPGGGEIEGAFSVGVNGQLYLSPQVSLFGEWNFSEDNGIDLSHDAGSLGIEFETGGHFFKLLISNSVRMNPAQFMGGTPFSFDPDEWRLGFNITRIITL